MDTVRGHFAKIGPSGVPLSYVIRDSADIPPHDLGFAFPDLDQDIADRGRHDGIFWPADNKSVWSDLRLICHGTDLWNTIRRFEKSKNGRGAFVAMQLTLEGDDIRQLMARKAETVVNYAVFDGRSKNWTLDKHVDRFREAQQDLEASGNPMTEESMVRKLLNSFQHPQLGHVTTIVDTTPRLKYNFEAAQAFLKGQLAALKLKNSNNHRSIAQVETLEEGSVEEKKETLRAKLKAAKSKLKSNEAKLKRASKKNTAIKDVWLDQVQCQ